MCKILTHNGFMIVIDRLARLEEVMEGFYALKRKMISEVPASAHRPRITHSQWLVLFIVSRAAGTTIKEISRLMGITSSAATQLVNGLVRKGYMIRGEGVLDRRSCTPRLSPKATRLIFSMKKRMFLRMGTLFAPLTDREFMLYIELNKKIVHGIIEK